MSFTRTFITLLLLLCLAIGLAACSKGKSPVEPSATCVNPPDMPLSFGTVEDNRSIIAVYDVTIDSNTHTFSLNPVDRTGAYHFPLTKYYPNVLKITGYGWDPDFWANIKLVHPYPGSGINAFDARVIAIMPAKTGVSFNYHLLAANANNKVVIDPDGYTKLFDSLGGSIPGNTNPFKAYFKDQPNRVWSSTGVTTETQKWRLSLAGFGGSISYKLVVDVSTNYPAAPQPVVDNCPEPAQIDAVIGSSMTPDGGSTEIDVLLLDWQGEAGIGNVVVEAPSLFSGVVYLSYVGTGPDPNTYVYTGLISNALYAPEGEYNLLIAAQDSASGVIIYDEFTTNVWEYPPFDFKNVTAPGFTNFSPTRVFVAGNYAYCNNGADALYIFNVSNPLLTTFVNRVVLPANINDIYVAGGYAFLACGGTGLVILDVSPPEDAYIVNAVNISAETVNVTGDYAYVGTATYSLEIIDINPPDQAAIVKSVAMTSNCYNAICVTGGYAYCPCGGDGLTIIDVEPISSAYVVRTVNTPGVSDDVDVSNGYAYVADEYAGLQIIDVDPASSAHIMNNVDYPNVSAYSIELSGGYAYIADGAGYMTVIDIDPPASAFLVTQYDIPNDNTSYCIDLSGNYAYMADGGFGLKIVDISTMDAPFQAKRIIMPNSPGDLDYANGYAYCIGGEGLYLFDISKPDAMHIISWVNNPYLGGRWTDIAVQNGYAYVTGDDYNGAGADACGLYVIDVDPPETAHMVRQVSTVGAASGVDVQSNYAYVVDGNDFAIIDITTPESAFITKSVDFTGIYSASEVFVAGGYAYVGRGGGASQLLIIDVDPVESAYVVKMVDPYGANDIFVSGDYAYFVHSDNHLHIANINPPESASNIKEVVIEGHAISVFINGGFAYVATQYNGGIQIVDIDPPLTAHWVDAFYPTWDCSEVQIFGNYAYIAGNSGLQIYKLW